jgi:hypothetical protein
MSEGDPIDLLSSWTDIDSLDIQPMHELDFTFDSMDEGDGVNTDGSLRPECLPCIRHRKLSYGKGAEAMRTRPY